jgi:hypothetical protein
LYDSQPRLSRDRKGLNVKVKEYDQERCKTLEKRDDWALNGWGKLDNKDKEEKEDCRKWEDYARWETRPPTLSATEAFFKQAQATLCESCKSIPVVEMICSMSGKDSNTTESKIASEPDGGCGLCKILPNWNTENESNRPIGR